MADNLSAMPITPETSRELARVAKQVDAARQRRDALIVQAHAKGAGLREIGRLVGMTHRAVSKIVGKGDTDG